MRPAGSKNWSGGTRREEQHLRRRSPDRTAETKNRTLESNPENPIIHTRKQLKRKRIALKIPNPRSVHGNPGKCSAQSQPVSKGRANALVGTCTRR